MQTLRRSSAGGCACLRTGLAGFFDQLARKINRLHNSFDLPVLFDLGATVVGILFGGRGAHSSRVIAMVDALGLGAYAAFGGQKSLLAGRSPPAAILVGVINPVGGGVLRDLLSREEPLILKPG